MMKLLKSQCFGTRPNVGIFSIRGDIGEKAEGPLLFRTAMASAR